MQYLTEFKNLQGKNVLLLQGPLGPFFRRFANELIEHNINPIKMNFNGGDDLYHIGKSSVSYKGTLKNWPVFCKKFILDNNIECVFLLGNLRPYHKTIPELSKKLGILCYVFEEGYLRPNYITLEKTGANANSTMSKDPDYYLNSNFKRKKNIIQVKNVFIYSAVYAALYYVAMKFFQLKYPHYVHHRKSNLLFHCKSWLYGSTRRIYNFFNDRNNFEKLKSTRKKYFLFPLQVHNDFQLNHSKFNSIKECIKFVTKSFAKNAPEDVKLVIKHHPCDRPYCDYTNYLNKLIKDLQLEDRIIYIFDININFLIKNAIGVVVMNSTTGITAIEKGCPVKTLGKAVYDVPGLTYQGTLSQFWHNSEIPDKKLYNKFRAWLENNNQINGNFYCRLKGVKPHTGTRLFNYMTTTRQSKSLLKLFEIKNIKT